jgi:hypothetical protein
MPAINRLGWLGSDDLEAAWDEAWALVTAHSVAVRALGAALLIKERIEGAEVEAIVHQAPGWRAPPPS